MRNLITILGIPIDILNMNEAIDRMDEFIRIGRATGKNHQVATVNADFIVKAMGDPELRSILQTADMATADGMPLVWGGRWLGAKIDDRVAGSDFVPALARRAARKSYTIYFLGAGPGIAAKAAEILKAKYPELTVAGVNSPPFRSVVDMDPSLVDEINSVRPDILLVAFGNPKQEKWINMYRRELCVPLMIGVGGTLDFITGHTKRAPRWLQRIGLEWLHRLLQDPRRLLKRYVVDIVVFGTQFARQWWYLRPRRGAQVNKKPVQLHANCNPPFISLNGRLEIDSCQEIWEFGESALKIAPHIFVNLENCEYLDSSAIGALMGLANKARDMGGELLLVAIPKTIQRVFSLMQLGEFFVTYLDIISAQKISSRQSPDIALG